MDANLSVAVISGGASGLGEATVRALVAAGAKAVIADLDEARGQALADELGERATFCKTDVSSAADVEAAFARAASMGEVRVAVSCAGIGVAKRILDKEGAPHPLEAFQKTIAVNLIGTFNMLRLGAAAMAKTPALDGGQRGVIVSTASIAAFDGQIGQIAYSASKGGVVGMTLPAARDLAKVGVRVNTICPGTFDTPLLASLPEAAREGLAAVIPFPARLGRPAEFGALVAHIVANDYLNGEVIRLDGALRMGPK
jgi:NAD(P)-dependent dehydrogenase (short-subunit alcohol dehydrogenase family)